ncbi:acyl-CoA thioesterase [Virgibacillus sp. W0430]|uniref:acyl-CoA thioesterase n=1 Tax=Virgibacillus sp. W0430 TaxID=3391580 RepID=UPI003F47A77E
MSKWNRETVRVHYKDTDQMGVVHHANYVRWFEIGRTEWLRAAGLAYRRMESLGLLLPVIDLQVNYQQPAKYDDVIAVFAKVSEVSAVRLRFDYEVRKVDEQKETDIGSERTKVPLNGQRLASGSTLHIWVKPNWRPTRINKAAPEIYQQLKYD